MSFPTSAMWIAQSQGAAELLGGLVPMLLIFGIFWLLLIAPMRRRQKKLQALVAALKRGDKVITTGGIYGEIHAVDDRVVHLKVGDNVRLKVAKAHIAGLEGETEGGPQ